MDPHNFEPFNVPARSQVQHAASEEPQTGQAGQESFEQHLAEASQANSGPAASQAAGRNRYPHLSREDRDVIDKAIAQWGAQPNRLPSTVRLYTYALLKLANDFRARGQTTDLADHQSLLDHVNTHFSKDVAMKTGLGVLRAYHDSGYVASRGRPRTIPSAKDASSGSQQSPHEPMGALARSNLLPSEEVVINDEHDTAELRPAKRPRAVNNPQGVAIERQLSEITNSGGGDGAMPAASALQPAQPTGIVIRWDKRPLYSEDAPVILGLEEALIKGGMTNPAAKQHVSALLSFSRWLFAKNRPSIVARMDSKSLSDGGDIHEFTGGGNKRLFKALEHLRTLRSTGVAVPVVRPGRARAELNPPPQNAPLINPEDAVLMEPRRVDAAAAPHSAPQEAGSRPEEH